MPLQDYQTYTLLLGGILFSVTKSTNLSSPRLSFLFTSPLPYHLKSSYSLSFLNSRLLLVVLSVSSRLMVSKADTSPMRVADRFGLTFYDTWADSVSQPQTCTTASECSYNKKSFFPFHWILVINLAVRNMVRKLWWVSQYRYKRWAKVFISVNNWNGKINLSITKKTLPFFHLQNVENFHQLSPQQKNKGKLLFPLVSKITWKPGSIIPGVSEMSVFLSDAVQNPESTFQSQETKEELNNKMSVPILAAVNSSAPPSKFRLYFKSNKQSLKFNVIRT